MGDRMTAMSDQADMAPSLIPIPAGGLPRDDVGDDWEEQQRRWAGGRAPVATGPKSVEDFSEIEEAAAGVQGDRCDCLRVHARTRTRAHTHCPVHGGTHPHVCASCMRFCRSPQPGVGSACRWVAEKVHTRVHKRACVPQIRVRGCEQYAWRRGGNQLRRRQLSNRARSSAARRLARLHVLSGLPGLVQVPPLVLSGLWVWNTQQREEDAEDLQQQRTHSIENTFYRESRKMQKNLNNRGAPSIAAPLTMQAASNAPSPNTRRLGHVTRLRQARLLTA